MASDINSDSSGSDSGSTPEEERIRRLFQTCDGNGDGYIDSQDLLAVCRQLNLEHCVEEIMEQLGADENGRISYSEFLKRRMQLINEINALTLQEQAREQESVQSGTGRHSITMQQASPAPDSSSTGNWPTSSDSQGSHGASGKHESWEFDSGARDLSPEPNTLHKLIEAAGGTISGCSNDLLELANKLHLAKLDSLKSKITELTTIIQHTAQERDILERQLNRTQLDRLRLVREQEERLDQQAQRYEERLTELHSVIAELSKKLEAQRASIIKEEDECSQQSGEDSRLSETQSHCTSNDNNATESCSDRELSRFGGEEDSRHENSHTILQDGEEASSGLGDNESSEDRPMETSRDREMEGFNENRATSCHSLQISQLQEEIFVLRTANTALRQQLDRQEAELNRTRAVLASCRDERDRLQRRIREAQSKLASLQSQSSQGSQTGSSPTRSKSPHINPTTGERTPTSREDVPIAKMAERVRLKKMESGDRHILGSEISSLGLSTTKMAEHLAQNVHEESYAQEIFQTLFSTGSPVPENKIKEFEVEMERLNSRIEHLKSQNDLLNLTLDESKGQCDRLSVLIGKYESNNTALQLALSYSDQAIESFEVLLALLESEQDQIRANCKAVGLVKSDNENQEKIMELLKESQENRKAAENVARHFLQKLDRSYGFSSRFGACNISPWEDLSSHSHTTSTSSSVSSTGDTEFSKADERRLREYIVQLKNDRAAVRTTVVELESIHVDPINKDPPTIIDAQKLDLENAVLMQELMAMKEEKAELKAQVYLLEKEKTSLELQLSSREAQEQAYLVQIEHFKSELQEQTEMVEKLKCTNQNQKTDNSESEKLSEAAEKISKLKARIQELVVTMENVTKNSEMRAQQSVEFVNDLKRTNSALVIAFEKAKKKQQTKVKKLELQMSSMTERHNAQVPP
ncbi:colorectal mutant cancer protein-like isoform X2 [Stegodyphus dumicola]|uniref:colorectal mutant cancer protein-like isoform X2 n=1 Tax=Stegodyphus dumicola TaxID=202533 RepID=UPI0015AB0810|nr:colorectal mutant cancer protein-like isoform X2 [Stegodyphus dumicola]